MGYAISRYSGAAFKVDVVEGDGSVRGLDVFGGFLADGYLHLMGEIRTPFEREWIFPLGTTTLEGRELPAPADTDEFLTATYGPSWRVPDPAYKFGTPPSHAPPAQRLVPRHPRQAGERGTAPTPGCPPSHRRSSRRDFAALGRRPQEGGVPAARRRHRLRPRASTTSGSPGRAPTVIGLDYAIRGSRAGRRARRRRGRRPRAPGHEPLRAALGARRERPRRAAARPARGHRPPRRRRHRPGRAARTCGGPAR